QEPEGNTKSAEIKLSGSRNANAWGRFSVGVHTLEHDEAVSFERIMDINYESITGRVVVRLYSTGQWEFFGHLHNTNFATKKIGLDCGIEYSFNNYLHFGVAGGLNGSLGALDADKSFDFRQNGTNWEVVTAWQNSNLNRGVALSDCYMKVETLTEVDVVVAL